MTSTDLEVLVRSLLPLAGHSVWWGPGEAAQGSENGQGKGETSEDVESDLLALTRGRFGTGAVRTEGNPVGCEVFWLAIYCPHIITMTQWLLERHNRSIELVELHDHG